MSHLFLSGEVSLRACSGALACCIGMAHCWAQRTLRGNECEYFYFAREDWVTHALARSATCERSRTHSHHSMVVGVRTASVMTKSCNTSNTSLYISVAERQSCKLKVLGSIPSGGFCQVAARAGAQVLAKRRCPDKRQFAREVKRGWA